MALKVRYTRLALADLAEAMIFISRHDPVAARSMVARIETAVAVLPIHPDLGRPGRITGTRELVVPRTPFIVPYRIAGSNIEVLAVIHGRRAWPSSL
ncbi:MAG: type II toxin-antitoxin system RelE/ParE family toxin [Janthinobacterium lividum]